MSVLVYLLYVGKRASRLTYPKRKMIFLYAFSNFVMLINNDDTLNSYVDCAKRVTCNSLLFLAEVFVLIFVYICFKTTNSLVRIV